MQESSGRSRRFAEQRQKNIHNKPAGSSSSGSRRTTKRKAYARHLTGSRGPAPFIGLKAFEEAQLETNGCTLRVCHT